MIKREEYTDWYYFVKGEIFFSKYANMERVMRAEVVFAMKDGLYIIVKNRYKMHDSENVAFMTRKAIISYVQSLYDCDAAISIGRIGNIEFELTSLESHFHVSEDSPVHIVKNRWE